MGDNIHEVFFREIAIETLNNNEEAFIYFKNSFIYQIDLKAYLFSQLKNKNALQIDFKKINALQKDFDKGKKVYVNSIIKELSQLNLIEIKHDCSNMDENHEKFSFVFKKNYFNKKILKNNFNLKALKSIFNFNFEDKNNLFGFIFDFLQAKENEFSLEKIFWAFEANLKEEIKLKIQINFEKIFGVFLEEYMLFQLALCCGLVKEYFACEKSYLNIFEEDLHIFYFKSFFEHEKISIVEFEIYLKSFYIEVLNLLHILLATFKHENNLLAYLNCFSILRQIKLSKSVNDEESFCNILIEKKLDIIKRRDPKTSFSWNIIENLKDKFNLEFTFEIKHTQINSNSIKHLNYRIILANQNNEIVHFDKLKNYKYENHFDHFLFKSNIVILKANFPLKIFYLSDTSDSMDKRYLLQLDFDEIIQLADFNNQEIIERKTFFTESESDASFKKLFKNLELENFQYKELIGNKLIDNMENKANESTGKKDFSNYNKNINYS